VRKLLLIITMSCALVAFAPATALAKRHHHHHRHHHARVHHRTFGTDVSSPTSSSTSSAQSAGTIQTFANGVLTILLSDGSTVSGRVTTDTEIECPAAQMPGMGQGSSGGSDDNDDQSQAGNPGQGDDQGENDQGDDDQGEHQGVGQACSSAALAPPAAVQEAELSISSQGAVWNKIELAGQSSSQSGSASQTGSDD
jgi:hypothetical protein